MLSDLAANADVIDRNDILTFCSSELCRHQLPGESDYQETGDEDDRIRFPVM